ncbi:MAG: type II CRISPR RNA-guided endonuclease Cas9, partial [Clostridiales bacterium]|nr:type II CRISPR RNA-guided endonuclease Cas9 [Clostridiales bacterium]
MDKFYLGLDIGTNSVGIACTDENYNLLRAKGKDLWAVRLFDEAQTAATRRTFRVARRRLQRRAWRIDILQEIFEPQVDDKLFFKRLNNSGFVFEDKDAQLQSPYSLFADKAFTDKDFYKKYKTIYHLRRALANGDGKFDIRLYYLAIHHIVKYRGHFLFDGLSVGEVRDVKRLFDRLNEASSQVFGDDAPVWNSEVADKFREIALCRDKALNDKKKACLDLFECADSVRKKAAVTLMLGGKEKPNNVYATGEYKEEKSFSFGELTDEEYDAKCEIFGDDFEYLDALHGIY